MNNRAADYDIPVSTNEDPGSACRNAVNVDFSNTGRGRRRKGFTKVVSCINGKDAFSCDSGVFIIEGLCLKYLNDDNSKTILYNGLTGTEYAFDYINGTVYFSDGSINLKIKDGAVCLWGLPRPATPTISSTSGEYGSGTYLAAICWVDENGVESGASKIQSITVNSDSGFLFSNLPSSPQI
jgi:hypothetical protein